MGTGRLTARSADPPPTGPRAAPAQGGRVTLTRQSLEVPLRSPGGRENLGQTGLLLVPATPEKLHRGRLEFPEVLPQLL